MTTEDLVIGIDGGGSTTVAWLSRAENIEARSPLGHGQSGPCNPQSVGWDVAKQNLGRAVDAAFVDAGESPQTVSSACVALAGGDRVNEQREIRRWADDRRLARRVRVENDALPVLAAGADDQIGIALIAGTGSIAFGRDATGQTARAGGWGHLLGDEGGSYAMSVAALRAVARSLDGRAEPTALSDLLMQSLDLSEPADLIPAVYQHAGDRAWIASLSPIVFAAVARKDAVALSIVTDAGQELARLVGCVAHQLRMVPGNYALMLAGGALAHNRFLEDCVIRSLETLDCRPGTWTPVARPVAGSVILAREPVDAGSVPPGNRLVP